jgi:hypothetical protein
MKPQGFHYLLVFLSFMAVVSLGCAALTSSPTAEPKTTAEVAPTQAAADIAPTDVPADSGAVTASDSQGTVTFTDENNYYQIDVPGDWEHTNGTDTNLYWDRFSAPGKDAFIENIAYDDGTPWTGGSNGKGALYLLNNIYSSTGKAGDIKVTDDKIQKDGSERLTWTSKGGDYSGMSFFEVRDQTTFLMFTLWWNNNQESAYSDTLNSVISSYRVP